MSQLSRDDVINYLSGCGTSELIALVTEAFGKHPELQTETIPCETTYTVIAQVFREVGDDGKPMRPSVYVFGQPDQKSYGPEWRSGILPICQIGHCADCGIEVASIAKHARCPICGGHAYLT